MCSAYVVDVYGLAYIPEHLKFPISIRSTSTCKSLWDEEKFSYLVQWHDTRYHTIQDICYTIQDITPNQHTCYTICIQVLCV